MSEKKIYVADPITGVRLEGNGTDKLSYAKNMIRRDGLARKRQGWRNLYNFRDDKFKPHRINGIYEYKGKDKACLVIHAGEDLYECSYDLTAIEKIPVASGVTLKNQRSNGYMHADVLWLGGMGQLLAYDGEMVQSVWNASFAYTPTTAVGIRDKRERVAHSLGEPANLITGKRINRLRGSRTESGGNSFYLDALAKYGKPFSLQVTMRVRKSTDEDDEYTTPYVGLNSQGEEVNTIVILDFYTDSLTQDKIYLKAEPVDLYGNGITIAEAELFCQVKDGYELCLGFDAVPYQRDTDNIIATFFEEEELSTKELDGIEAMTRAVIGGDSVMVLSCGTNKLFLNYERKSGAYLPRECEIFVGDNMERVCALLPMSQSALAVYKTSSFYVLRLNEDGNHELILGSGVQGSVNSSVARRIGEDCLALSIDGVYGVKDSDSKNYIYTNMKNRGEAIQGELNSIPTYDLKYACACVHKGAYYLFLNDKVYVAQPSTARSGDEYDWWIFDNCPAYVSASIGGTLYMGRLNGDVAAFDEEFTDRCDYVLLSRDMDFVFSDGEATSVIFNYRIGASEGDKISIGTHYIQASVGEYDKDSELIKIPQDDLFGTDGYVDIFDGAEAIVIDEEGYTVYEGGIKEVIPSQSAIYCGNLGLGENCRVTLYIKMGEGTEYTLKKVGGSMRLCLDGKYIRLYDADVKRVTLKNTMPIECEIYTPVLSLGGWRSGTLYGIMVTPSENTSGFLDIGYETGLGAYSKSVSVGSSIDFNCLDFGNFGFNSRLKQTIKFKCLERNVDHIRVWVRSISGADFGIDKVALIYKGEKNE